MEDGLGGWLFVYLVKFTILGIEVLFGYYDIHLMARLGLFLVQKDIVYRTIIGLLFERSVCIESRFGFVSERR